MTNDDPDVVAFMKTASVDDILKNADLWGEDISFMADEVKKNVN